MGTRFELVLVGEDAARRRTVGEAALAEIVELDARWSLFRRDSLISFINANAHERSVRVDADTFAVLDAAERVRIESRGLFDVTVGAAMARWGFRGSSDAEAERSPSGGRSEASDTAASGLELDEVFRTVRITRPGVSIDLGGIAKGYAIDAALRTLREHGVTIALIHGGTSCVGAIGAPPDEDGWRVAIGGDGPVVSLRDRCMAVSSPSGRMVDGPDGESGHIIDPRTHAPAACARVAAVIGPSAMLADAWTKPVLIERGRPAGLCADYTVTVDGNC